MESVSTIIEFHNLIQNETALLFYFSHEQCNVCKVLKPKIETELSSRFPDLRQYYCDIQLHPELSAQNNIFIAPTILIYMNGQESFRFSRHISIDVLKEKIDRPYQMLFGT